MTPGNLRIVEAPDVEPVTLDEAKRHCRIESDFTEDDDLVGAYIAAATSWAEGYCNRYFVLRLVELSLDSFPCGPLELPGGQVQSVVSVKYRDTDGAEQTWDPAEYDTDLPGVPARLTPGYGYSWPAIRQVIGGIRVRYMAGYAETGESPSDYRANIPRAIRQAVLMLIGSWYEHRESVVVGQTPAEVPHGVESLLWPHRILAV